MFDGVLTMSFSALYGPPVFVGNVNKKNTSYRTRSNPSMIIRVSSILFRIEEGGNLSESKKTLSSKTAQKRFHTPNSLLRQGNVVGIIGGVSVLSTLIFLEKLVWWSSRDGEECVPFVVCNDPTISRELSVQSHPINGKNGTHLSHGMMVENLRGKRVFLQQSGARCIVMPCHISQVWHDEISEGCSVPFFNAGDCVAKELKEANLKPLEAGSGLRIGVIATDASLVAGFYKEKLRSQGFEVVLLDRPTMEHTVIPAVEALDQKDMEGARTLLRIAIQALLVRAVNSVILASEEFQGLLPRDDPLRKKCIDPMDALVRYTVKWARFCEKVHIQS